MAAAIILVTIAAASATIGFGFFVEDAMRAPDYAARANGIVVLTGGADRVETALRLLAEGRGDLLLVSGVAHGAALADLAHRIGVDPGPLASKVTLGRAAQTTLGNAEETAGWAETHDMRSLIVVTAGYHMPRALLELHRSMPDVRLFAWPVAPQGMTRTSQVRLLGAEYVKYVAAWLGLSGLLRSPISQPAGTPVDNSVHG